MAIVAIAAATVAKAQWYDFSAEAPTGQTLYYVSNGDGGVEVIQPEYEWEGYIKPAGDLTIPSSVMHEGVSYNVSSLRESVFAGCSELTSVTIEDGIVEIGERAFENCSGVTSITLPNGIYSIGGYTFSGCSSLASVVIPDGIDGLGDYAFQNCSSMVSVVIPSGVTYIGIGAFTGCSSLTSAAIPDGITAISEDMFSYCSALGSVAIPNSVIYVGENAFRGCSSLSTVVIPDSVRTIGRNAFDGCTGMRTITVPDNVNYIGIGAFTGISHVSYHGDYIQNNPWGAEFLNGVVDGDFAYTDSTKHNLMVYIGQGGAVTIPESVDTIGPRAFMNCAGLTSVTMGNGVVSLGIAAFSQCPDLTTVTIGNGIVDLGSNTFSYCPSLTSVTITAENPPTFNTSFGLTDDMSPSLTVYAPNCKYKQWSNRREASVPNVATPEECVDHTITVYNPTWGMVANGNGEFFMQDTVATVTVPSYSDADIISFTFVTYNPEAENLPNMYFYFNQQLKQLYVDGMEVPLSGLDVEDYMADYGVINYTLHLTTDADHVVRALFGPYGVEDTTAVDTAAVQHDTVYVEVPVHDTTYVEVAVHDTTYVEVAVHDTTYVEVPVHDTTYVEVAVHDTTYVEVPVHDTTTVYVTDTVTNTVHDTTVVYETDTLWMYDTVFVYDTVYVHDTVYAGVDDVETSMAKIYQRGGRIVVECGDGVAELSEVAVYDALGRRIAAASAGMLAESHTYQFDIPASGTYLVRVGKAPARRIVVVR